MWLWQPERCSDWDWKTIWAPGQLQKTPNHIWTKQGQRLSVYIFPVVSHKSRRHPGLDVCQYANPARIFSCVRSHAEKGEDGHWEESALCAWHTEGEVWKVPQCERTVAVSHRHRRAGEINGLRRAAEWQSGQTERQRTAQRTKWTYSVVPSQKHLAVPLCFQRLSACGLMSVCFCACVCVEGGGGQVCRQQQWYAGPAPFCCICTGNKQEWDGLTSLHSGSSLLLPSPSVTSLASFTLLHCSKEMSNQTWLIIIDNDILPRV